MIAPRPHASRPGAAMVCALALVACGKGSQSVAPPRHDEGIAPASAAGSAASSDSALASVTSSAASTNGNASASSAVAVAPRGPFVSTSHLISWIFEKPRFDAPHAGYLRAGEKTVRSPSRLEGKLEGNGGAAGPVASGCTGGWYGVEPAGFVCVGHDGVTLDLDEPAVAAAAAYAPDFTTPLPYGYGTTAGTPFYTHVPSESEQKQLEGDVAAHVASSLAAREKMDPAKLPPLTAVPLTKLPAFLEGRAQAPSVMGWPIPKSSIAAGHAWPGMRLSFLSAFESDGRAFYLTTEHFIVPADRVRAARLADFKGIELSKPGEAGEHLPMMWVRWRSPKVHKLDGDRVVETETVLPFQSHASIAPKERVINNVRWFELLDDKGVTDGRLVRVDGVTRVDAVSELPYNVGPDDAWIEVSIGRQSLVLYRGLTPIFTTLVSTGVDGADDVETTRSTPRGSFRIHSKHYSYRMSADEHDPWKEGDKPDPKYRIDDVPYVQYFQGGYALHAAYWHDSFGNPKSHGCINLSPRDALWLFSRTLPLVPSGWHGAYSGRAGAPQGTYVVVRAF